jgi:hypothetical protein
MSAGLGASYPAGAEVLRHAKDQGKRAVPTPIDFNGTMKFLQKTRLNETMTMLQNTREKLPGPEGLDFPYHREKLHHRYVT